MLDQLNINKNFICYGLCPYFPSHQSMAYTFSVKEMDPAFYEKIINQGFRRNGIYFYQNLCPHCCSCIPIRVDIRRFKPSKSQRRVLRKNRDVKIIRHPVSFDREGFLLYRKYCDQRHDSMEEEEDYTRFLIDSAIPTTEMMRYYAGKELIGIGWTDVLPDSLSSVYFAFNPDHSSRSPGVFSLLKELELCRELQKRWLHLGFWIKENRKMSYKSQYKPCQILFNNSWQELLP